MIEVESCESTQDLAWEYLSKDPKKSFVAVRASSQTHGRGRQARNWVSTEGNLFLTLAFRVPKNSGHAWPFASLLAGQALAESLDFLGAWDPDCFLKWPNDLYRLHHSVPAKMGGILCELRKDILLVGIGVNIQSSPSPEETPYATTFLADSFSAPNASSLAHAVSKRLHPLFESWLKEPRSTARSTIHELSKHWMRGFFSREGEVEGLGRVRALSLLEDGCLEVQSLADPTKTARLSSGEFRFVF